MSQKQPECPLCGRSCGFYGRFSDRFYQTTEASVDVYRCSQCVLLFQYPIPSRAELASFYPSGYWREADEKASLIARLQRAYVNGMIDLDLMSWWKRLGLRRGQTHLDIGCSRGDWLARIRHAGITCSGLESDERAVAFARASYGLDIASGDLEDWHPSPETFDAISAFHVLEHVRHPEALLRRCHQALRQGGKLLIRVPNIDSWQAKLCGKRWKGLEIPRHVHNFSMRALRIALQRCGFRPVRQSTWSWRDGPPGWSSSLFPGGEPTRQQVLGKPNALGILGYFALTWAMTPVELLAALLHSGGMATVIALKES